MGGVGELSHFADALSQTKVDAIAAANIFQYVDQSVFLAKNYLAIVIRLVANSSPILTCTKYTPEFKLVPSKVKFWFPVNVP